MTDEEEARFRAAVSASGLKAAHFLRRAIERELAGAGHGEPDEGGDERIRELELYAYLNRSDVKDRHRREFARAHPGVRNAHLRPPEPKRPKGLRFQLALNPEEVLAVEAHGAILGLRSAQFCTVLIRRWLGLRKAPPADTANVLGRIRNELRRIGVNINQIARAANACARPIEWSFRDRDLMTAEQLTRGVADLPKQIRTIVGLVAEIDVHLGRERRYWDIRTVDTQEVDLHPSLSAPQSEEPI